MNTQPEVKEKTGIRGFFRVHLVDKGSKIVGDSGWKENQVVNTGFNDYLCKLLGNDGGSKQVTHMALGTGSQPNATHTVLTGEVEARTAVTAATSSSRRPLRH